MSVVLLVAGLAAPLPLLAGLVVLVGAWFEMERLRRAVRGSARRAPGGRLLMPSVRRIGHAMAYNRADYQEDGRQPLVDEKALNVRLSTPRSSRPGLAQRADGADPAQELFGLLATATTPEHAVERVRDLAVPGDRSITGIRDADWRYQMERLVVVPCDPAGVAVLGRPVPVFVPMTEKQTAPDCVSAGRGPNQAVVLVGDTGFEPVTSSVSRKRSLRSAVLSEASMSAISSAIADPFCRPPVASSLHGEPGDVEVGDPDQLRSAAGCLSQRSTDRAGGDVRRSG